MITPGSSALAPRPSFILRSVNSLRSLRSSVQSRRSSTGKGIGLEFTLSDQYDKLLAYTFPRQKAGVLTLADKQGATQIEAWVRPLYDRYQDRVDIHGIAVLAGLPSFARGLV